MRVKFTVTEEDIANGKAFVSRSCPIALALSRKLNYPVSVGAFSVYIEDDFGVPLSKKAEEFVIRFDGGLHCEPATFVLDLDRKFSTCSE